MCLGEIGRVTDTAQPETLSVSVGSRLRTVSTVLLETTPQVGEWVLVHSGLAIATLTDSQARAALQLRQGQA